MTKPDAYLLTYREISHAGSVSCVTRAFLDNDPVWADPDCRSLELISEVPLFKAPPEATQTRWIKCSERIPIGPGFLPKGLEIVAWLENLPEFVP